MNRILFLLLLSWNIVSGQEDVKIVILHTNDLHSRLNGFSPEAGYTPLSVNDDQTVGGFSRIASVMKREREANTGVTLTIDAGDFLMGTLFQSLEEETGFQLRLMKKMGYDAVCIGNHEFDFGPGKLAQIISRSASGDEIPAILTGNAIFNKTDPADDGLEKLLSVRTAVNKYVINNGGIRFGLFSLMGKDAVDVAPKAAPVTFQKQTDFARKMVKELEDDKCDIIICVSHSGVTKLKDGSWGGEDVEIAQSVKGIDLIISGHTHTKLVKPVVIKGIPIVQTGEYGQNVGRIEMTWSAGKIASFGYRLIAVNDSIMGDSEIQQLIEAQQEKVSREILEPLGLRYNEPVAESDFLLECNEQGNFKESNLGPLVADAIHYYINKNTSSGCDISMVATGVIRDRIVPGILTAPDLFRVMSLGSGGDNVPGYPLSKLYITGKELKSVLEILQVAYKSSPSNFCFYSGMRVEFDPGKGLFRKIRKIDIIHKDGSSSPVDFSKHNKRLYSLTANSYMLEFIGIIKKMSFGLINVVPKDAAGVRITDMSTAIIDFDENLPGVQEGKEWLALLQYMNSMSDTNGNGIKDIDRRYSVNIPSFFNVRR